MDDSRRGYHARHRWLMIAMLCFVFLVAASQGHADTGVRVYLAGGETAARDLVSASIRARFGDELEVARYSDQTPGDALVITLGGAALSEVRANHAEQPVVALFVSSKQVSRGEHQDDQRFTAVFNDPPLIRQARLGTQIVPGAQRVAILASPERAGDYEDLMEDLEAEGLSTRVFVVPSSDQLIRTLSRALSYGDFILGTIDDEIYNRSTIKHLLLTSYRRNRLVIGPARAYVQAGSVASTYASSRQQIERGLEAIADFMGTGELADAGHPPDFRVSVNAQVARSMNIPVPSEEQLREALRARETGE